MPQQYSDPICNIYHNHVVLTFSDPAHEGRRTLLLDIRDAVGEVQGTDDTKLAKAIATARARNGTTEKLPEFKKIEDTKPPAGIES